MRYVRALIEWFRRGEPDLQRFFEALPSLKVGLDYTRTDRYRDFRSVFMTEQGRRVLSQIIAHCEGRIVTRAEIQNHADLSFRAGQREPGQWIIHVLNAEPPEEER